MLLGFLLGLPVPLISIWLVGSQEPGPIYLILLAYPLLLGAAVAAVTHASSESPSSLNSIDTPSPRSLARERWSAIRHELKTPLTPILGYSEMILDEKLGQVTERQRQGLTVIVRNVHRLRQLIDDLNVERTRELEGPSRAVQAAGSPPR